MKIKLLLILLSISVSSIAQKNSNNDGRNPIVSPNGKSGLKIAASTNYSVIDTIPILTDWIGDITFDQDFIWVGTRHFELFKVSSINGDVLKTVPISIEVVDGLTFDGNYLWVAESTANKTIQKIDPVNGQVVFSFNHQLNNYATHGMTYINNQLWINMFFSNGIDTTFIFDTEGNVQGKFVNNCVFAHGIAFDGNDFWISANGIGKDNGALIYKYSKDTFTKIDSIPVPGGQYPNGLDFHNGYLWLSNAETNNIYKIDIGQGLITATKDIVSENTISIYPNPFQDHITIQAKGNSGNSDVEIFDAQGSQIVKLTDVTNESISLHYLKEGIYFYYVRNGSVMIQQGKLIKYN